MKYLQKITNLNYLTKLTGGNTLLITDMIQLFITEVTTEIQQIEKGIMDNDFTLIKSSIHNIRGVTHYVGLDIIVKKDLLEMEKLAINQIEILEIEILFSKINTLFISAIEELNEWILHSNEKKICE